MEPIVKIKGKTMPLMIDDIDTDRIIPSRFLRCVTFDGIGEGVFYDERFDEKGNPKDFPMNNPIYEGASIIISSKNFGCGSSREHAPQSIKRAGFNAVIAESFAEIFFGNSTTIGLPCVTMSEKDIEDVVKAIEKSPEEELTISLDNMKVTFAGKSYDIALPKVAKESFLAGSYDQLAELLKNKDKTEAINKNLPY